MKLTQVSQLIRIRPDDKRAIDAIAKRRPCDRTHVLTALVRLWMKASPDDQSAALENEPPRGRPRKLARA